MAAGQWAWPQGSGRGRRAVGVAAGQWAWPQGRGRSRAATSAGSFSQYCSVVPRGRPENACWIHEEDERSPWHLTPLPPCPLLAWLYIADGKELWVGGEMGDKPVFSWATLCTLSERRCLSFNSPENTTLANGELHIFFSFTVTKVVVICCFYSFAHM